MPTLTATVRGVVSFDIRFCDETHPCDDLEPCNETGFQTRSPGSLSAAARSAGSLSVATRSAGAQTLVTRSAGSLSLPVR